MTSYHKFDLGRTRTLWKRAFSLVEIMVTVALLSFIILGLVAMFNQTRRAFMSSLAQVDVLEAGRATAELISRDLQQMAPNYYPGQTIPSFAVYTNSPPYPEMVTQLASPSDRWTNIIQELFLLTPASPNNQQWNAIGYRLQTPDEQNAIGTLYRFYLGGATTTNSIGKSNLNNQVTFFVNRNWPTNMNRIIDGVTHFVIRAYDQNGLLITNNNSKGSVNYNTRGGYMYYFYSNAVPAYVEVELGILETQALEHYRAFGPGTAAANNYLTSHPGVVHLFRQRVPIRNFDPSVFP